MNRYFSKYLTVNKDKIYPKLTLLFFAIWLFCKGPLRWLEFDCDPFTNILIGIAPNFFAAVTLVFWIIFLTSSKPLTTFLCVNFLLVAGELFQLLMPNQTADYYDVAASFLGSVVAVALVVFRFRGK